MIALVPNSYGTLREFNPCHSKEDGKFCSDEGAPNPLFPEDGYIRIRIGDLPKSGRSTNHTTGAPEAGVSVYGGHVREGVIEIEVPQDGEWADADLATRLKNVEEGKEQAYVVVGERVGRGHDGEELLSDVTIEGPVTIPLKAEPQYVVPDTKAHPLVQDGGLWGSSHGNSYQMSGRAAELMGIEGYDVQQLSSYAERRVDKFLSAIAGDTVGSEEPLYHGFQNVRKTQFKVGDTLKLPLTATSGGQKSISYGVRSDLSDQEGEPTLFAFPKGTPMAAYQKWRRDSDGDWPMEFRHVYSEAIVAGEFEVAKVRKVYFDAPQHDEHDVAGDGARWHRSTQGTIVYLRPMKVFDPETKRWRQHRG